MTGCFGIRMDERIDVSSANVAVVIGKSAVNKKYRTFPCETPAAGLLVNIEI